MSKEAPNYREIHCESCDNCKYARRGNTIMGYPVACGLYYISTRNYYVCDSWEEEQ